RAGRPLHAVGGPLWWPGSCRTGGLAGLRGQVRGYLRPMDYEYEAADDYGGRVLWGRVAVFGVALLLALILGRCTAGGGGGVPEDEHRQVVERLSEAESTIANQEATIQQLQDNLQEVLGQGGGTTTPGTGGT